MNVPAEARRIGRIGRPPRIDRVAIADAVLAIGFEEVTMRRVADHLGVSVPGLYHHVRGRDDLLKIAAERAVAQVALPEDEGQHWAEWLRAWARYIRAVMAGQPELVEQFANGGLDRDRLAEVIEQAVVALRSKGFTRAQAEVAWDVVSRLALGSAVEDIRAAHLPEGERNDRFERLLTTVLVGIAAEQRRPIDF